LSRPLGFTSLQILAAIRDGSAYGLDIVVRTGLPSGTVYPTLGRLKRAGLLTSRWEDQRHAERDGRPRRRYYEVTAEGGLALAEGMARAAHTLEVLRPGPAGANG
jgi:DNA-binding PadR family transcriptional regulator